MSFKIGQFRSTSENAINLGSIAGCTCLTSAGGENKNFKDWKTANTSFTKDGVYFTTFEIQKKFADVVYNIKIIDSDENEQFIKQIKVPSSLNLGNGFPVVSFVDETTNEKKAYPLTLSNGNYCYRVSGSQQYYYLNKGDKEGISAYTKISSENSLYYHDENSAEKEVQISPFAIFWVNLNQEDEDGEYYTVELTFSPRISGDLVVEKIRDASDYAVVSSEAAEDGSGSITYFGESVKVRNFKSATLSNIIDNGINVGGKRELSRIGVWAHPSSTIVINNEPLTVGWNGYFEIAPTEVGIQNLYLVIKDPTVDKFLIDYEYEC